MEGQRELVEHFQYGKQKATAILTGRYVRSTFVEDQREFVEHFQYGKQIGKTLDITNRQKRPRAPKHILLGLKSEKPGNQVPIFENLKNILNLLTKCLCIMGQTLFQTSSRGSELKQHRFGIKFRNPVKMQS